MSVASVICHSHILTAVATIVKVSFYEAYPQFSASGVTVDSGLKS